jgi:hypothetical protein
MSPSIGCLEDDELLVVLAGEPASELLRAHLDDCPDCRSRLDKLQSELSAIRLTGQVSAPSGPVSTDRDPGSTSFDRSPAVAAERSRETATQSLPSTPQPWTNEEPSPAGLLGKDRSAPENEPIPTAIGKYLVVGRFPRSGQAQVFRVVHPELRRDLVLKLAHQPIDEDGRSDVVVDGQRLAELEHPNIVRIHDLDFVEGRPYLVMEYIRGRTLAQYAREEPVAPRQAAALVAEIAGAVAFAHCRGIVHQDIKPANILIDEAGRPRLIDFGMAWQQDAWSGSPAHSEGGTFAYMAPEQARVDLDRVRPLSDVFALGGLLYFLLAGNAPFDAATPEESWERARRCDFDRAALKNAGVPRLLERICLKAMDSESQRRYRSAAELAKALRRVIGLPRIAIVGATASLLVLGLLAVVLAYLWPAPHPSITIDQVHMSSPTTAVAAGPLRIVNLSIEHLAQRGPNDFNPRGKLGERSFAVRAGDDVTVQAELSEPAYAYLIAFRPDGVDEICDPEQPTAPPAKTKEPRYPPASKTDKVYRLEDGAGLHAFALVVSRAPLPPYEKWKNQHGTPTWNKGASSPAGVVWWHDGQSLAPLTSSDPTGTRGKDAPIRGGGNAVAILAAWLRGIPGVDAVAVKAFPVPPATVP